MAHFAQQEFIREVKSRYPESFHHVRVLDCGSLDINGNNREFFKGSDYIGLDIITGKNVDIICPAHEYGGRDFDVVISTEMLEHDRHWEASLANMYCMVKEGGLLILTAAGEGRDPHGVPWSHPKDSPATWDYYRNITKDMIKGVLKPGMFSDYHLRTQETDIYFYGTKNDLCGRIWRHIEGF
jgi:SAM-dependent methyltransferase